MRCLSTLGLAAAMLAGCSGPSPSSSSSAQRSGAASGPTTTGSSSGASSGASGASTAAASAASPTAGPRHVMVLVLENREETDVLGSPDAPYLNQLAHRYGLAVNSFGQSHPSLPNYLSLIGGQTFGINSDCESCSVSGTTLADQLEGAGISWRAYMEGVDRPCYRGDSTSSGYAKKHDPFMYFPQIADSPSRCANVVPFGSLQPDLQSGSPPAFIWVTPNLCHDGHDCPTSTMDKWVSQLVPEVQASPWYASGGVIIITFDEGASDAGCCRYATGGRILTIVVSAATPSGARSTQPVDHAGTLATVEDLYGLGHIGLAGCPCSGSLSGLL